MTAEAVRKPLKHLRRVRYLVAVGAIRQIAVAGVTFGTVDLPMPAVGLAPASGDICMAALAGFRLNVGREGNLQGLVDGVTHCTGSLGLFREVGLVAFGAVRDAAVALAVTVLTSLLGMGAGELLQL